MHTFMKRLSSRILILLFLVASADAYRQNGAPPADSSWYATVGGTTNSTFNDYGSAIMTVGVGFRAQKGRLGYELGFSIDNRLLSHASYFSAFNLETNLLFYPFPSRVKWNPYLGIGGQETIYRDRMKIYLLEMIKFKTPRENRAFKGILGMQFPLSRSFLEFSYAYYQHLIEYGEIELRYGKAF